MIGERVVVNQGIPFKLKLKNPLAKLDLVLAKQKLREETLTRIKMGNFSNGLYPLINIVQDLSSAEIADILTCWGMQSYHDYIDRYKRALKENDLEAIKEADEYFLRRREELEANLNK